MPQTLIDFDRGERAARRADDALAELGLPLLQRAAVYLLLAHESSRPHHSSPLVLRVSLTWRSAAEWLRERFLPAETGRSHSGLVKAVAVWQGRGIMHAAEGRLWLHGERLRDWHEQVIEARQQLAAVDPFEAIAPVASSQPTSRASRLPTLPLAAFGAVTLSAVVGIVREWWTEHELTRDVVDPDELLGAIIAARRAEPDNPQRYVETCLDRGVNSGLVVQARKLRTGASGDEQYELTPAAAAFRQQQLAARKPKG